MPLGGKRVLVIAGSAGIGLAAARAALDEGAEVVVASSSADRVDASTMHALHFERHVFSEVVIQSGKRNG